MLEVLNQDYIRTAYAKGLKTRRVISVHALRNSLNPVVTAISGWFASMLAGVVFIEYIFGWRGLGYMLVNALNVYDLPVVLGCVLTTSVIFVIVNILMDFIYAFLDPRIRK
jgi:peptide/nickel transport system permease protein